jgi:hypothetical protein
VERIARAVIIASFDQLGAANPASIAICVVIDRACDNHQADIQG